MARLSRAAVALVVGALVTFGLVTPANAATGMAGEVFTLVNQQRASQGLPALVSDPTLDHAAATWAQYLASTGQFIHSSSSWRSDMISGAGWTFSGENIAAGYPSSSTVMNAWMNSSGHRANILNGSYVGVGIGYVSGGPYGHYWVQIFAGSAPRVTPGSTPVISGSATVGGSLTASTSGWPSGTTLSWSWASGGVTIPGATSQTYTPTITDGGRKLTVSVTGSKSGYYPATTVSAPSATVSNGASSTRIAGANRYEASANMSRAGFAGGAPVAFVASGIDFPDALSAAPAAVHSGGPLLLTHPTTLSPAVDAELRRLAPARIVVTGGPVSVSEAVVTQLQSIAPVTRLSGATRYEVSRAVVDDAFESAPLVYLATGKTYPDALTAGAAAGHLDAPVILVDGTASSIDPATLALLRSLGTSSIRIAGGSLSVSDGIRASLSSVGFTVDRRSGANRYEVAQAINAQAFGSASSGYLASGQNFPDALAGAALAGYQSVPLYLSAANCVPVSTSRGMTAAGIRSVTLLGGTATLSPAVASFTHCP
ncbi:putative cell wall-binding protein [Microbacteriaceae bacterium SG_E_30_P1]|uniref:Cell wall-binding protein n=1 Tax=Antiquaquibacter oligotrophicus TaxID=2880260 RepID=A0ABT6KQP9_9MICO|nr:cell wall-binding repeat-containing protein [Antiquaquibacter oligotrophicus]MDH6182310.1 putative cell wall-binding protein [Antiquaquibacter oligotrophicus]UDF12035.1 cell wall-binding repeat-containing protein [Antiquaquibacter oligotrophicus]